MVLTSLLVVFGFPLGACVPGFPGGLMGEGCGVLGCAVWGFRRSACFPPLTDIHQSSFEDSQYFIVLISARRGKSVHEVLVVLVMQAIS